MNIDPTAPDRAAAIPGTQGYAQQARELIERYEAVPFAEKHQSVLHLLPDSPAQILDIGAGTGADAAWFAERGHRVLAVEPTDELRLPGIALHPSPLIEWLADSLPGLELVRQRRQRFDLVLLSAVWMHLDAPERRTAMPKLASLLAPGGLLILSLRHGAIPYGRCMFEVSASETVALAQESGLRTVLDVSTASAQTLNQDAAIRWSRLAFARDSRRSAPSP